MSGRTFWSGVAILVAVGVALGSLGSVGAGSTGPSTATSGPHSSVAPHSVAPTTGTVAPPSEPRGLARALAVEAGLRAKGISPAAVHLPNFAGAVTERARQVVPTYPQAPAPMGIDDLGLENHSGSLVPYELNTTGVAGTVNITNLQSLYVDGDGPDSYGVQLNSVAAGVTIFGNSSYDFWSQNYVTYTISTHLLVFGDEVWNFSSLSGVFPTNSVYGFSPNGTWADFPYLYQGYGPAFTIGYPFTLTLYLNTSTIADRPAFYFNYSLSNATFHQSASYDYLIFNSTVGTPTQAAPTPVYQADGYNYDPIGLPNDMEIDLLGNDDGDMTAFTAANATLSLEYVNATSGKMQEVPSAFNAGSETGETAVGLTVYSSGGTSPIALVRAGPSFLSGLWNWSSGSGAVPFTLHLSPANTFLFVNIGNAVNVSFSQWVPTSPGGTTVFYLPTGGTYFLDFLMSNYDPTTLVEVASGPTTLPVTLVPDLAQGIYTPLLALSNAELASISSSGAGTQANPYVLYSDQAGSLAPQFATWDDFLFPTFPGLLLAYTTAWVDVTPPSFEINLPPSDFLGFAHGLGLPLTNDLQIQFYDASNISLVNAPSISGWLSGFLTGFAESTVIVWNCTNVLVASNHFADQGNSLEFYGGTGNTVWGNTFVSTPTTAANPAAVLDSGGWVTGVNETESGDLIYNNLFEVPVPAITPTVDPYQCAQFGYCFPLNYTDSWNVSRAPATATRVVNGFTLTGSIIGTSYQGGNSWSNYGTTANPFGVLPYNDSGFITRGGDFVPLVPFSVYPVTFDETGLATGAPWNVTADGILAASVTSSVGLQLPNGTYSLMVGGPAAYGISAPAFFTVSGAASVVSVTFVPLVSLTVKSSGLGVDAEWSASINGTGTGNATVTQSGDTATIVFEVTPGTYNVTAAATAYTVSPRYIQSSVGSSGASVTFTFSVAPGRLALKVTPTTASVYVNGALVSLTSGALTENLSAGLNSVEATASGYAPYFNNVSVSPQSTLYLNISLVSVSTAPSSTSSGLSSTWLAVLVGLGLLALIFLIGMVYFARRRPPPSPQPWPGGAQYPPPPPS